MSLMSRTANLFRARPISREIEEEIEWRLWEAAVRERGAKDGRRVFGSRLRHPRSLPYHVRQASPVMIAIPLVTILATTLAAALPAGYAR